MTSGQVIHVRDLRKAYGGLRAVDGVSFDVFEGEVFGLLGPNGAGKTTTLSILEGLRGFDGGRVRVLGHEFPAGAERAKRRIGIQLQSTSLIPDFTVSQQVRLFAQLYGKVFSSREALAFLEPFGLAEKSRSLPGKLSGGQQQRLALALALVNDPELVFLDEPTASLDPQSRRSLLNIVRKMAAEGRTVILTTHHIEEAQTLCARVGIMDHGKVLALDSPAGLIRATKTQSTICAEAGLAIEDVQRIPGVLSVNADGLRLRIDTDDLPATNRELLDLARERGIPLRGIEVRQPSLEDVFLALTGTEIRNE